MNIFEILNTKRHEDPHDRMLAWMCDPTKGHGLNEFASALVNAVWGTTVDESVQGTTRQYKLSDNCWPDVVVEFEKSLLVVENKVSATALREGQLELQHELATERQAGAPLYHCLLCPDRVTAEDFGPKNKAFGVLRYSTLAELIESRLDQAEDDARPILSQYAAFISSSLGAPAPKRVKMASPQKIAGRNEKRSPWHIDAFMKQAEEKGGRDLQACQHELHELLISMDDIEARYTSKGESNATYRVFVAEHEPEIDIIWVYADGRIYVRWGTLIESEKSAEAAKLKEIWKPHLPSNGNKDGAFTTRPLCEFNPTRVVELIQQSLS